MGKKLSKLLGVFCVGLLFALCGITAGASANETLTEVPYLDENGNSVTTEADVPITVVTDNMTEWTDGWYVVKNTVDTSSRINVNGNVHLILTNGAILNSYQGIDISRKNSITIYSQQYDGSKAIGKLNCNNQQTGFAAIGGSFDEAGGAITINGGDIYSQSAGGGAAIGGGYGAGSGSITINGGSIDVFASDGAAGIGAGYHGNGENITITGGSIQASGGQDSLGNDAAGIGGGVNGAGGSITITGGIIDRASSIGSGENGSACSITLDGSAILASEDPLIVYADRINAPGSNSTVDIRGRVRLPINKISTALHCEGKITITDAEVEAGDRFELYGGNISILNSKVPLEMMVDSFLVNSSEIGSLRGTSGTLNNVTASGAVYGTDVTINGGTFIDVSVGSVGGDENSKLIVNDGNIANVYVSMGSEGIINGGEIGQIGVRLSVLNIFGGSIDNIIGYEGAIVNNYSKDTLSENFSPTDSLYIDFSDEKSIRGIVNGYVSLGTPYFDNLVMDKNWEILITPGSQFRASIENRGAFLVAGVLEGQVTGNSPYYAINADSETVASVSAGDSIVRDGVTFVPEGKVVTLKSKGTGAMHWAAQPAYLNVTNNKFYMPDEVVSVKASALPLEATPAIQVNGEKLTGFTAGEYYSISDAIFRPTGTTLPIRPEWYGTTVSIVKLGDGFATGDSFAQALAIPSQSSGTVTPPNPGGGTGSKPDPDDPEEIVIPDGDWEEAEEELSQADSGDTVIVETDEDDTLPDEVLESAAGKNVTLKIKVGDSIFWEIDCRVIPKDASLQDISLKVSMNTQGIPSKVLCGLPGSHTFLQMTLGHDGLFGFPVKLRADVGRGNSGKWANLYYYNEETGKMEFETAARITASGDAVFTMAHASQYAIVLDEKSHTLSFQDVGEGAWFQGAVEYVYRAGLMAGTGDTTFEPNAKLTRAMTAQILYNLEGQPEVTGEATFTDMNTAPDWSMDAIAWAQDTGVVAGMGDNTFAPNLKVTREQFAQMLYNYAKYKKCDLTKAGDLTKFPDKGSLSDWAVTALSWANGNGLINGHENGTLDPQGNTVRGQAASILMNFDLNVVKSVA